MIQFRRANPTVSQNIRKPVDTLLFLPQGPLVEDFVQKRQPCITSPQNCGAIYQTTTKLHAPMRTALRNGERAYKLHKLQKSATTRPKRLPIVHDARENPLTSKWKQRTKFEPQFQRHLSTSSARLS